MMKKKLLAAAALAVGASSAIGADVGGINLPLGATFGGAQLYTNIPTVPGQQLSGYGKIDSLNSLAVADLCAACELTYVFDGYVLESTTATEAKFSGGSVRVYLGVGAAKDFSTVDPGSSVADDIAEASNGVLWLGLKGHTIEIDAITNKQYTFISEVEPNGALGFRGDGGGLLDVDTSAGGLAAAYFNSNTIPALFNGPADFDLTSSFSSTNPLYGQALRGTLDLHTTAVPEPQTYALMLSALGLIGFVLRRNRRV